ncbi:hypothetical protein SynSYN20_01569 [Synechococcus sp. SYN20]|uniref:hypothetical protein n=1 Tax=Synechococcus sp. SYN20 TaxID=1050714 RepID=UPI0016488724|nr:hypothetical protein [Synechococcus sp. SYN20]QNJ25896.1 hypothetical protein SynSYN20_01569 [Synechococcus sp. SYN20]
MNNARRDAEWLAFNRPSASPAPTPTRSAIVSTCNDIRDLLLEKNQKYGDSALNPQRVFSGADPIEQIKVRIDDKLSRIQTTGFSAADEDTLQDLIGYLVLLKIALSRSPEPMDLTRTREQLQDMVAMTFASDSAPTIDEAFDQDEAEFLAMGEKFRIPSSVIPGPDCETYVPFEMRPEDMWEEYQEDVWEAERSHFAGNYAGPLYAPHPEIKKDLSKFEPHEIYETHYVDGAILGTQKNGDVRILGTYNLYDEIKKASPLDL